MAAVYRLLAPHLVNNVYLDAGSIVTEGKELPIGWKPTHAVDPQNSDGVLALWQAGPREDGRANATPTLGDYGIRGQFSNVFIAPPLVYWRPFQTPNTNNLFILTGAGAALGPVQGNG